MSNRTRLTASIVIPLLVIVVVVGAFLWQQHGAGSGTSTGPAGTGTARPLTTVKLALDWTPNTNHTGIYVALAQGWYAQEGIRLEVLPYSSNVSPDVLVSTGKADVGISSTEGVVTDAALGQPVVSIAAIIQHNTSALVTLAKSGLKRPRDLDGKVYAAFGAPYETAVVSAIIKHDGGKGVFRSVTLDVDSMQALETGRVDFVWVFEGWEVIQAQRQGVQLNVFPVTSYGIPDYYTPTLITGPSQIKAEPDLLRRFMAATARGYEYARQHPREAAQMLLTMAPKGTFPDPGLVYASQEFLSPRYADSGRRWGWQDSAPWHGYPQFILNTGQIKNSAGQVVRSLNFDSLYTNAYLPQSQ
ncbi:ABC transporter substrate-binding protein [Thermogemmatispora carboxidivorans]|uniref:ABC transporter substrate-binding protein n=1 Tax=Thermogemmatispora carboxidivorans TaxID=1382306 RepID=UPI00069AA679|nr:ABC transporter substrate-binding protein [Thermogemmatispora carboxidivorans]